MVQRGSEGSEGKAKLLESKLVHSHPPSVPIQEEAFMARPGSAQVRDFAATGDLGNRGIRGAVG